jgi:outer membrane protein OmpA-like peptidoglycan-associated protein
MRAMTLFTCVVFAVALAASARAAPGGDRDGDGIPDSRDKCPDVPEDRDGFEDDDGCPDPDNDKDGIPDVRDKCPNDPETFNGYQDDDGCPDRLPAHRVVVIKRCPPIRIALLFRPRSTAMNKPTVTILKEVVAVMKSNPQVRLVEVQGHADDYRSAKADQRLSLRRAQAVRRYLIKKGVAPERLVAKGYGRTQPRSRSRKARERRMNRRVTFKVLKQTKPPPRR